ncbi:MAG TPA: NAD(P)H-dependent oxidoreductase [Planktothrix sp.]
MSTLLHIDSSGKGSLSVTQPLTAYFARKWQEANPSGEVIHRHLGESNLQFVNAGLVGAFYTPSDKLTSEQKVLLEQSDRLIDELIAADVFVFGVPMYNFSVPAIFKAYIDLVVRAGKTFSYEGGRPQGLLANKRLFVITASGGDYSSQQMKGLDFVEPYVSAIMSFIGVSDITFIKAHGTNPEIVSTTSEAAMRSIDQLLHPVTASRG